MSVWRWTLHHLTYIAETALLNNLKNHHILNIRFNCAGSVQQMEIAHSVYQAVGRNDGCLGLWILRDKGMNEQGEGGGTLVSAVGDIWNLSLNTGPSSRLLLRIFFSLREQTKCSNLWVLWPRWIFSCPEEFELAPECTVFIETCLVLKIHSFMKMEGTLPCLKISALDTILNQLNQVRTLRLCFCKINFNITFPWTLGSPKCFFFLFNFSDQNLLCFSYLPMSRPRHPLWFKFLNIVWRVKIRSSSLWSFLHPVTSSF
jgi:hypothetical protein